ncbi:MAG TPA: hypothetical protein VG148_10310 [Pyrinomonadaceae bacterium]|nr:hypothetical protein [Pyrinomonadaceae bacterium]
MSIMIALAAAVTLGTPGGNKLFDNTGGGPLAAQTDYNNNNSAPRAETQSGINPVQHSE